MAQDGKATGDSPLNVRPHAEVSVNENTKVTHHLGWNDVMRPNPECRSWQLVLTASSGTSKQLRLNNNNNNKQICKARNVGSWETNLRGVQLETVG